jgi:hypothetical protein
VLAVIGIHIIGWLQAGAETDYRRLFAEIEVTVAADARPVVHLAGFLFKAAHKQHLMIVFDQGVLVLVLREGGGALLMC